MHVEPLPLDGAMMLTLRAFADERGYFKETFSAPRYRAAGIVEEFAQDNISFSHRNVLRGLHGGPATSKLVQVVWGKAYDVIVDVRAHSPTRGRWCGFTLRSDEHRQIYIPPGFLHGFLALSHRVGFLYKQSKTYDPLTEVGVAWNDPDLEIDWPLHGAAPLLSPKDAANPRLRELGLL
jgi:dTDP-4-dehydrorhamnose 3,5-epimerase